MSAAVPVPSMLPDAARGGPRRSVLFFAFAFAVIADPVSSVAYAIEAALRALHGHLELLLPTMGVVVGVVLLVAVNYWQLVGRFPQGGGAAAAAGREFGAGWTFWPIGALVVDFALTIGISIAAATSALIALLPALAPARLVLAMVLLLVVSGFTLLGHHGRLLFAAMTAVFLVAALAVVTLGLVHPAGRGQAPVTGPAQPAVAAVLLAFPVAMALATGVEAPSTAIAQLGQLDDAGRRRFGRGTLAVMVGVVGTLTLVLTWLAVHLGVGVPAADSTQIADVARAASGHGAVFGVFQTASSLLLLAAASSSFQAGPGLLKALAAPAGGAGVLPAALGRTNRHHTPVMGVAVYTVVAAAIILAAGGLEQRLVLFYAVAVFVSFLVGLLAMLRSSWRSRSWVGVAVNAVAAVAVAFTLAVNLARGYPLLSLLGMALVAGGLYARWIRAGRPRGIEDVEAHAEEPDPVA